MEETDHSLRQPAGVPVIEDIAARVVLARPMSEPPAADEWWTTKMVCAYLKISRKTLWERRRNRDLNFPRAVNLGGGRNLYRASAVRAWAETMARAQNEKSLPNS